MIDAILKRAREIAQLPRLAAPLAGVSDQLDAFSKAHS